MVMSSFAPRGDILTTIDIKAPPGRVWTILTVTKGYPERNPMIAGLRGDLIPGTVVENFQGYANDQVIFWPTMLVAKNSRELRRLDELREARDGNADRNVAAWASAMSPAVRFPSSPSWSWNRARS